MPHLQRLWRHPRIVLLVLVGCVVAVGHRAPFIAQDNSPHTLFAADADARRTYRNLVDTFGTDEVVLVELRGARPDRPEDVQAIGQLSRELSQLDGVKDTLSVAGLLPSGSGGPGASSLPAPESPDTTGEGFGTGDGAGSSPDGPPAPEPAELKNLNREIDELSIYRDLGLARPSVPALGVAVAVVMKGPHSRTEFTDAVYDITARYADRGYRPLVAGQIGRASCRERV